MESEKEIRRYVCVKKYDVKQFAPEILEAVAEKNDLIERVAEQLEMMQV